MTYARNECRGRTGAGWPFISIGDKEQTILVLYGKGEEQIEGEREAKKVVRSLNYHDAFGA